MQDLKYYQDKIKEKRMKTPFRDFLKEISSWCSFVFNKNKWLISKYPNTPRINICSMDDFNKNVDNLVKSWLEYDNKNNFFSNYKKLLLTVKLPNLFHYIVNSNCDYSEASLNSKNAYLSNFAINENENIFYTFRVQKSTNVYNSLYVINNCENIYFSRWITESFNIFYCSYVQNSANIWFSSNLTWCSECIFCNDLDNQSYSIKNKKLSKKDYLEEKKIILKEKNNFLNYYNKCNKLWVNQNSSNVTGNFIIESTNVDNWHYVSHNNISRNVMFTGNDNGVGNFNDVFVAWWTWWNDFYGIHSAWWWANLYCSISISFCENIFYSYYLENCSYCIWCIGLKNKSYCILNKQYTKEEWNIMADKIFSSMEKEGTLWNFFPWELNPFYFNDTVAWLIWWFTKEEVTKEWYMWRDEEIKVDIPEWSDVILTSELDKYQWYNEDWDWKINPEILKKVIKDEKWNYYRIVQMEYDFLVKHNLPLPEIHWMDRMKLNFWI